jgi:peptidoglycan/LPS O-acetylase OafA/YrhL
MSTFPVSNTIAYLDGWRGLAIGAVLVAHFGPRASLAWTGGFGVQLFFVLSGFLMSNLLFIKKVDLADFFARRLFRVIPTFLLFVATVWAYSALFPETYQPRRDEMIGTLLFVGAYYPADMSFVAGHGFTGHLWSLNVEEHSYLFLALIAFVSRWARLRASVVAALLVASVLSMWFLNFYYPGHPPAAASPWFIRSECAALGLVAAAALRVGRHCAGPLTVERYFSAASLLAVAVAALAYAVYAHKGVQYTIAPLLLAVSINYIAESPDWLRRLLSSQVLGWLGRCSFSLYLWQQPFFVKYLDHSMAQIPALLCGLLAGIASFYLFEDPIRRRLNSMWSARRKKAALHIGGGSVT